MLTSQLHLIAESIAFIMLLAALAGVLFIAAATALNPAQPLGPTGHAYTATFFTAPNDRPHRPSIWSTGPPGLSLDQVLAHAHRNRKETMPDPIKTITLYAKRTGCMPCNFTKRKLQEVGLITENSAGQLVSAVEGVEFKLYYLDDPGNEELVDTLKSEGRSSVPYIQLNFPLTPEDSHPIDEWTGFIPSHIGALANQLITA
ncbi:hypothetical protein ACFP6B_08550 [Rothia nasimurium]|uniref:hypothetical protein n=1 Tax=Rothia nasimurium TaxID=85336 RepID=UPI0036215C6E